MTKLLTSIILFASLVTNAQSIYKKSSELKKRNEIKQTDRYLLDKSKSINPMFFGSYVYDRNGRIIDSKEFFPNYSNKDFIRLYWCRIKENRTKG